MKTVRKRGLPRTGGVNPLEDLTWLKNCRRSGTRVSKQEKHNPKNGVVQVRAGEIFSDKKILYVTMAVVVEKVLR